MQTTSPPMDVKSSVDQVMEMINDEAFTMTQIRTLLTQQFTDLHLASGAAIPKEEMTQHTPVLTDDEARSVYHAAMDAPNRTIRTTVRAIEQAVLTKVYAESELVAERDKLQAEVTRLREVLRQLGRHSSKRSDEPSVESMREIACAALKG
jgi:hypothetical protein